MPAGSYNVIRKVWQGLAPPRAELLTWFVLLGRLNTKDRLIKLNVINVTDDKCVLCHCHAETVSHLFLSCVFSWRVWNVIIDQWGSSFVLPNDPMLAFDMWMSVQFSRSVRTQWITWFFVIVWSIWELRNKIIFHMEVMPLELFINLVLDRGRCWIVANQKGGVIRR